MDVKVLMVQKFPIFNQPQNAERAHFHSRKPTTQSKSSIDSNSRRRRSHQTRNNAASGDQEFRCRAEVSEYRTRKVEKLVAEFNPEIPIEAAVTPPSSWYTDPDFYDFELNRVFYTGWQVVGCAEQIREPLDYFTGRLGRIEYVVSRDEKGMLHAFHNVCRHHASVLAAGAGKKSCFVCPYHGWTYGLDGALVKATRITGIKNFKVNEMGLVPLKVAIWGPFVLINSGVMSNESLDLKGAGKDWLGDAEEIMSANGVDTSLEYVCRRTYTLECNWKVFCDNYLDGGYHVPYAHKNLASGLQLDSYSNEMYEKVSVQSCGGITKDSGEEFDRLGSKAFYAFVYPNFMINRYGPWMDTNLVLPLGPKQCEVIFDYFLDASLTIGLLHVSMKRICFPILGDWADRIMSVRHLISVPFKHSQFNTNNEASLTKITDLRTRSGVGGIITAPLGVFPGDEDFIEKSLEESERVQDEDITLCKGVQQGLESPAYDVGRYSPSVEMPMHHFHCLLHQNLSTSPSSQPFA